MIVAIEGLDGAGKGTQVAALIAALAARGCRAATLTFPRYGQTLFAESVADYLNGRLGTLESIAPRLVALLFAGDRLESRGRILELAASHDVLVLDRYVASNVAYQAAKEPPAARAALVDWILAVEFGIFALPRPDLTIHLRVPSATARELIARKGQRSYTAESHDLHERDLGYQDRVALVYDALAADPRFAPWVQVEGVADDGALRPAAEIGAQILDIVAGHRTHRD